jgi:hypothetical protein
MTDQPELFSKNLLREAQTQRHQFILYSKSHPNSNTVIAEPSPKNANLDILQINLMKELLWLKQQPCPRCHHR